MKWTNSYRSFGLKTKRSTGLKTIEHKHQEGGARHSERIDGGGVGGRQIGVAHTDGQGIHQRRRIILPQAAGHQKRGAANPADGYSVPAGAAEGYPRDQP